MTGPSLSNSFAALLVSCAFAKSCWAGTSCISDSEPLNATCGQPDQCGGASGEINLFALESSLSFSFSFSQSGCLPLTRTASGAASSLAAAFAQGLDSCSYTVNGNITMDSDDGFAFESCSDADSSGTVSVSPGTSLASSVAQTGSIGIGASVVTPLVPCASAISIGFAHSDASVQITPSDMLHVSGSSSVKYGDYSGSFECHNDPPNTPKMYESTFSGSTIAFQGTSASGTYQQTFASACTPTIEIIGFLGGSVQVDDDTGTSTSGGGVSCVSSPIAMGSYKNALFVRFMLSSTTSGAVSGYPMSGLMVGRNGNIPLRLGVFQGAMGYTSPTVGGFNFSMPVTPSVPVTDLEYGFEIITFDTHYADLNEDGVVCFDDYLVLHAALGSGLNDAAYTPVLDFDLDGDIDTDDVGDAMTAGSFAALYLASEQLAGDANCDCTVGTDDVNAVLSGWGGAGPSGDLNFDGVVDSDDMNIVLANWGNSC